MPICKNDDISALSNIILQKKIVRYKFMRLLQIEQGKNSKQLFVRLICLMLAVIMFLAACGEDTTSSTTKKKKKKKPAKKDNTSSQVDETSSDETDSDFIFDDTSYDEEDWEDWEDGEDEEDEEPSSDTAPTTSEDEDEGEDIAKVLVDRSNRKSAVPANYSKLVWSDEFDGDTLDENKWFKDMHYAASKPKDQLVIWDERVLSVSDGLAKLRTIHYFDPYDPSPNFACFSNLSTSKTMNWRYGYMEMCAKLPYKKGCWPSWWTCGVTEDRCISQDIVPDDAYYMVEVDMFEIFGSVDTATPNIHKWYTGESQKAGSPVHTQYSLPKTSYTFDEYENLVNEYHVYGFEWTPDYMAMIVDGEEYMRFDFSVNFDNVVLEGQDDPMQDFRNPMFLILGNSIYSRYSDFPGDPPTELPVEYDIDWIRLYQDPNVKDSAIWTKK